MYKKTGCSPPPWQATVAPETYDDRSLARNATTRPISGRSAIRPSGMVRSISATVASPP